MNVVGVTCVCECCLSAGRTLTRTPLHEFTSFFRCEVRAGALSLCWECAADARRALRLRARVRRASRALRAIAERITKVQDATDATADGLRSESTLGVKAAVIAEYVDWDTTPPALKLPAVKVEVTWESGRSITEDTQGISVTDSLRVEGSVKTYLNTLEGDGDKLEGDGDKFEGDGDKFEGDGDKFEGDGDKFEGDRDKFEGDRDKLEGDGDTLERDRDTSRRNEDILGVGDFVTKDIDEQNDSDSLVNEDVPLVMFARKDKTNRHKAKLKKIRCTVKKVTEKEASARARANADKVRTMSLSWSEVRAERQRLLSEGALDRFLYKCSDCLVGYDFRHKYDNHMRKHDPSGGGVQCAVCRVYARDAYALRVHMQTHTTRYACTRCDKQTVHKTGILEHYATAHEGVVREYACEQCGNISTTKRRHRYHLSVHEARPACATCGKSFRDLNTLRDHTLIHDGVKQHSCPHCPKTFRLKTALTKHLVIAHNDPRDDNAYYCAQCRLYFKNHLSYKFHLKNNLKHVSPDSLKFSCSVCQKRFLTHKRLSSHVATVHLKKTDHVCPHCSKACCSKGNLSKHVRTVHERAPRERNKICHTCGKTFYCNGTLESHLRTHTGERPYRCRLCHSTFAQSSALYNHCKRLHAPPPLPTDTATACAV